MRRCFDALQVYKGIKNGVQDVAVKVLIGTDEIQHSLFLEVGELNPASLIYEGHVKPHLHVIKLQIRAPTPMRTFWSSA